MIGILALQGGFAAHQQLLHRLGAATHLVRKPHDLEGLKGLVLPGGESTTIRHHLDTGGWLADLMAFAAQKPLLGTCAGLILMSHWHLLDVEVERNAYGRQLASFHATLGPSIEGLFIRAPRIIQVGRDVRSIAQHAGEPVAVDNGRHLAATFHPELCGCPWLHELFLLRTQES